MFERYVARLFGPKVWGLATRIVDGRAVSTPELDIAYEYQVRRAIMAKFNQNIDYGTMLARLKADPIPFQTHFRHHVAKSNRSTVTAPGFWTAAVVPRANVDRPDRSAPPGPKAASKKKTNKNKRQKLAL